MMTMYRKNSGFTTIELAMVMIIFGMIFMTVMTAFAYYNAARVKAHNEAAFEASNAAILSFQSTRGYYPCPADPGIGRDEIGYGLESRDASGACVISGDIEEVTNDGVNQYEPLTTGDDPILIGAIPFNTIIPVLEDPDGVPNSGDENNTIPLRDGTTYDGWNHKLLYAVTEALTHEDSYNDYFGAIRVVDENNNSLVQEKEEDTNNNGIVDPAEDLNSDKILNEGQYAHFVIVSHGENGRGAYAATGDIVENCPTTLPVATLPVIASDVSEIENCDENGPDPDGVFLSGLQNDTDHSENDDLTKFTINETSGLWIYASGGGDQIHNTNLGNVGFGTDLPREKLDINGNLRAQEVRSSAYCDPRTNPECLQPEAIAGELAAMKCPPGQAVVGIEQNAVFDTARGINHCEEIFSGAIIPRTCPANCRVTGFEKDANGDKIVICRNRTDNNLCP